MPTSDGFAYEEWLAAERLRVEMMSRARGLLVGLLCGDAVGSAGTSYLQFDELRGTVNSQLACFTVDGLIRALVRIAHHGGICHPPSVVWHAYNRWAVLQGIDEERLRERWAHGSEQGWPDGWLAQVPALARRRGTAPATVAAIRTRQMGTTHEPVNNSFGNQAMVRTIPAAVSNFPGTTESYRHSLAIELGALTHGHPDGYGAAGDGVLVASAFLKSGDAATGVERALSMLARTQPRAVRMDPYREAIRQAQSRPRSSQWLTRHAADRSGAIALAAALYVVGSFAERDDIVDALIFASQAADGPAVSATAGALLGALHGFDALPVELVSRLELIWVADVLARDLIVQDTEGPSGGEYGGAIDPHWWDRYPGS